MYLLVSFQRKSRKFEKSLSLTQAVLVFDIIKTADYSEKKNCCSFLYQQNKALHCLKKVSF